MKPVEVLQSPLTLFLHRKAGHPEWLSFAHQLPHRVISQQRRMTAAQARPSPPPHGPIPNGRLASCRHQLGIGDGRGTIEVLLGIADQHNVVGEEGDYLIDIVGG
jgi:hypothetical protein